MPNIKLPPEKRRDTVIQVRLNYEELTALTEVAGDMTVSQWVRAQVAKAARRKRKPQTT